MNDLAKHPKGLYVIFFTEMWERFSYYGMRALLVLYLTAPILKNGFELNRADALEIYAIFTGLIYFTPLIGGYIADKFIGQRKAVYIGALTMAIGNFCLAFSQSGTMEMNNFILKIGLGLLIAGTGFFKPCMPTILGQMYKNNPQRKDSAFTIFYMGVNLGAFLAPLVAGWLGERIGWAYGFSASGVGMIIGFVWFHFHSTKLADAGLPPNRQFVPERKNQFTKRDALDIIGYVIFLVLLVCSFIKFWSIISENSKNIIISALAIVVVLYLAFFIISNTKGKTQWKSVSVLIILCLFNIFFWAGFEQAGGTFNLFTEENTNRETFLGLIPASMFQSAQPLFIILLAPLFSLLWSRLARKGNDISTSLKFSLAMLFLGLGFIVINIGSNIAHTGVKVSPMWIISVYFLHTIGELLLSPIGLSMVTKLSPPKIVSVMIGFWYACMALAEYMAGMLESLLHKHLPSMPLYSFLTMTSIGACVLLLILTPLFNKMLKDS
jgi:POT family proton-dependent oligopeptide transporter